MPAPLGQLLHQSLMHLRTHIITIAVAAVVLGLLTATSQGMVAQRIHGGAAEMMQQAQLDPQKIDELQKRMQAGDPRAAQEMQAMVEKGFSGMNKEQASAAMAGIGMKLFLQSLPLVATSIFIMILLSLLASYYYFFVTLDSGSVQDVLRRTFENLFPLLGLSVWVFLRSFIWIPLVGIIIAIIIGPRFVLSNVILIKEKRGITESVRESYKRTEGFWGKIVGNMIVASVIGWVVLFVTSMVLGLLGRPIAGFVSPIIAQGVVAFLVIFRTKLALNLMGQKV